jgi:hypothetical protein
MLSFAMYCFALQKQWALLPACQCTTWLFKLNSKSDQNDVQHHYVQYRIGHMTTQLTDSNSAPKSDQNDI